MRRRSAGTHHTALSVEIRVHLFLKCRLVQISRSDSNTNGDGLLLGLAGDILVYCNGRVDSSTFEVEGSDGSAGSLGSDEDHIDVFGRDDLGL